VCIFDGRRLWPSAGPLTHTHTHTRTCTHTYTHTHTRTYTHAHAHTHARTRTHTHTHTHTSTSFLRLATNLCKSGSEATTSWLQASLHKRGSKGQKIEVTEPRAQEGIYKFFGAGERLLTLRERICGAATYLGRLCIQALRDYQQNFIGILSTTSIAAATHQ
jgi:hypothetical protein